MPESSAIAGIFANKDAFLAFNMEFSKNVKPVSGISGMPNFLCGINSILVFSNILSNSFTL